MTIHQPRHSIFSLFNRLVLLNEGETVYHGPCKNVVSYFADIGKHSERKISFTCFKLVLL